MTATEWIHNHYISNGKMWLRENFQRFCIEVNPKRENPESYFSMIKQVEFKLKLSNPELFDGTILQYPTDISTVDQSLDLHQIDLTKLSIKEVRAGTWGSGTNPNKQMRITYQPVKGPTTEQLAQDFIDAIKDYYPPKLKKVSPVGDCMLEVDIFDFHFGLLAWSKETGFGDYDMKIATTMFMDMISKIVEWSKLYKIEQVLFPIGNDFFNSDSHLNTTTKGTPQEEDSRWQKTFTNGWKLMRDAITVLRSIAPVQVIVIPANHDHERSYFMGSVIEAWFRNDDSVNIDNGPEYYKRYKYGKNLIGLTHGDKGNKPGQLPLLMASRWPKDWADTIYREWRTGHFHHESIKEYPGCKVVALGASSQPSEWGASSGYDSMIESKGTVWNKQKGKIATFHCRPDDGVPS